MKYLFAGGGTGGHIFPAISIADEIRKADSDAEILFIGAKGRIEEKIVPSNNYKLETINLSGIDRADFRKNIALPFKFIAALRKCRKIIKEFKPDVAIGTGGFVCGPVIYIAQKEGIPTLIQEGNSFAGKTIKFLAGKSDKVVINFPETEKYLKRKDNIVIIPHPVRSSLKKTNRQKAIEHFQLISNRRTIFIFGGSQGARGINDSVMKIIQRIYENKINVIWQTGKNDFGAIKEKTAGMNDLVKVFEFIENIDLAYSASDLVICRAGITSIMEIAYLGLAAILVPLPTSAENHQELNARSLEKSGAAKVILQSGLEGKLYDVILNLLNSESEIALMKTNVSKFADANAAKKIAAEAMKLIKRN